MFEAASAKEFREINDRFDGQAEFPAREKTTRNNSSRHARATCVAQRGERGSLLPWRRLKQEDGHQDQHYNDRE